MTELWGVRLPLQSSIAAPSRDEAEAKARELSRWLERSKAPGNKVVTAEPWAGTAAEHALSLMEWVGAKSN